MYTNKEYLIIQLNKENTMNKQIGEIELLTRKELAALLSISEATLSVWKCTGKVKSPYIKIGGAVRYKLDDIKTFLNENKHEAKNEFKN